MRDGAGETTTLRMILGLVAPSSGRALVSDHPYAESPRAALRTGAVLEATDFHPGRTGRDHLRMLGQAVDLPDSRADEVLRLVELSDAARYRSCTRAGRGRPRAAPASTTPASKKISAAPPSGGTLATISFIAGIAEPQHT